MSSSPNSFKDNFDSHEPRPELESPFLNEEYLAEEAKTAPTWRTPVPEFQLESPFLYAFEEGWGAIGEAEEKVEGHDEFLEELEEEFEEEEEESYEFHVEFDSELEGEGGLEYDHILSRIRQQLTLRFRNPDDSRLFERHRRLCTLFERVPQSRTRELYTRLGERPTGDELSRLFHGRLATATRRELLKMLEKRFPVDKESKPSEPQAKTQKSSCLRAMGSMTQLLPWERSLLALVHDKSEADFRSIGILIGPIILPGLMPWPLDQIVKMALKGNYAITIESNVWFPRAIDTSTVNDLAWLVHESVHVVDYSTAGTEAFLKTYIQQAVIHGFKHDDIPHEQRANRLEMATERMLARFPELVSAIGSCDSSVILTLLQRKKDAYRAALNKSMSELEEDKELAEPDSSWESQEGEAVPLDEQLAEAEPKQSLEYEGDEAPSEPDVIKEGETFTRYEPELSVLDLRKSEELQQEIILVAGANYPAFKKDGTRWKRSRSLSAGLWRQFCLRMAIHRLEHDPTLKVTLFDFLLGTREDIRLGAKNKATTTIEHSFVAPTADDYWSLVGIDLNNLTLNQLQTARLEAVGDTTSFKTDPRVSYFDGATLLSSHGKSIKLLDYWNATSKVTKPVISITDLYAYIEGFASTAKVGTLLELHFFAHAFNIVHEHFSGGPILLNSLDLNPLQADRHRLDKDARASKDFRKPTIDPTKFAQAFAADAKSFVWGCNFQRGFIRQFVHQVSKNAKTLAAGHAMKISYNSDWGAESVFRTRLGLSGTISVKNISMDLKKVESILRDANQATYIQKLATASGHPVVGGPPGTYADYDSKKSPLALMHIPMSRDPFRDTDVSFEHVLLFFKDHLGSKFDTTFGNHQGLGRGYMIYEP